MDESGFCDRGDGRDAILEPYTEAELDAKNREAMYGIRVDLRKPGYVAALQQRLEEAEKVVEQVRYEKLHGWSRVNMFDLLAAYDKAKEKP